MEQSNVLLKVFNIIFPFADFLYILQLEEYDSWRLIKWLPRFFLRRNLQTREKLKYTKRVKILLVIAVLLWFSTLVLMMWLTRQIFWVLLFPVMVPLFVLVGNFLSSPYFEWVKTKIRRKAQYKVSKMKLKIINVAGSFGKTTTKNFIYQLLQSHFRVQMIPGNINTPNGVADWINGSLMRNTEILISELDTYQVGEIARSSAIIPADIAVLTNIGDQHLERFGSEDELRRALAEIYLAANREVTLVTNDETRSKLSLDGDKVVLAKGTPRYKGRRVTSDLSPSNKTNLSYALKVVELLDLPSRLVLNKVKKLELPDRRQKLTLMYGFEAIDDSYNISYTTALAGIKAAKELAKKRGKKLLVITAGIPELSDENKDKNRRLGETLDKEADRVVVLNSMFADEIEDALQANKVVRALNLKFFLSHVAQELSRDEWFLLHQPELGDLYY